MCLTGQRLLPPIQLFLSATISGRSLNNASRSSRHLRKPPSRVVVTYYVTYFTLLTHLKQNSYNHNVRSMHHVNKSFTRWNLLVMPSSGDARYHTCWNEFIKHHWWNAIYNFTTVEYELLLVKLIIYHAFGILVKPSNHNASSRCL